MLKTPFLIQRFAELDTAINKAQAWGIADPELNAALGDYLAVFACGVFEDCVEHLVLLRAEKAGDPALHAFVKSYTATSFRNPLDSNIAGLLTKFSGTFKDEYRKFIKPKSKNAAALDSIVNTKNGVAHGTATKHVTVSQVGQYRTDAELIFVVLEAILT